MHSYVCYVSSSSNVHKTFFKVCVKLQKQDFDSFIVGSSKGQLISKCLFGNLQFSQKELTKKFDYYGTSSRIVFVRFLGKLKTPKIHFEINWPLETIGVS